MSERPDDRVVCGLESMVRLFRMAFGLGAQWKVVKSEMDVPQRQLRLALGFPAGTKFDCPRCGQLCAVHDTAEKERRHLGSWRHSTDLRAGVWRVIDHYVMTADRGKDWSKVRRILVDEPTRSGDSLPQAARRACVARQTVRGVAGVT